MTALLVGMLPEITACETITYSALECNPVLYVDTLTFELDSITYKPTYNGEPTDDPFLYNGCVRAYGGTPR